MATYEPTRGGKKKFLRDLRANPSRIFYSVVECVQPWGNEPAYRVWKFEPSRLWVGRSGHMSAEYVLANYGPLTDTRPAGMKPLFDIDGELHTPDPAKAVDKPKSRRLAHR
jgi:hypothetical protein